MTTQRTAPMTSASPGPTGTASASTVTAARRAWRKIGEAIREMNYAAGRVAVPRVTR
jgi:hypothetical protein